MKYYIAKPVPEFERWWQKYFVHVNVETRESGDSHLILTLKKSILCATKLK